MHSDMDEIMGQWKKAKQSVPKNESIDSLIKTAESRRRSSVAFHYGNMIALSALVVALILLFLFVFPFQETVSRIGVAFMVGTIVLRIIIEFYSSQKAAQINLASNLNSTTDQTLQFYNFRKKVHGPVTISIVALYSIGLGLLTGEFYKYIGPSIFVFDGLYCISGIILILLIRKGIKKEMVDLQEMIKIKSQLTG